jgi:hypothetical protein
LPLWPATFGPQASVIHLGTSCLAAVPSPPFDLRLQDVTPTAGG